MERVNVFKNYKNKFFVETGCFTGDGIQFAIESGFEKIYSIELSDKYFNICKERFKDNRNVTMIKGDSALILFDVIKELNDSITFWLDGHFCYGDTAYGLYSAPLIQELEQISKHAIKTHTILVDDMRVWKKENVGDYGFYNNDIYDACKKINENYKFKFENGVEVNDILVAYL